MSLILRGYLVAIASMLAGAAVVHNIYKPDLVTNQPVAADSASDRITKLPSLSEHFYA